MDNNKLRIDSDFLTFFRTRAEGVSKTTAHWRMKRVLNGNFENIAFYLDFLADFSMICSWATFENVFIPYYEQLFGKDEEIHRFVKGGDLTFEQWKQVIIQNFLAPSFPKIFEYLDDGQYFDFITNYRVSDLEGKLPEGTLLCKSGTTHTLTVAYLENLDQTIIDFTFEVRGEMFNETPWGPDYPNFCLQKQDVVYNRALLSETLRNFQTKLDFKIIFFDFEWGSHPLWTIDETGFLN